MTALRKFGGSLLTGGGLLPIVLFLIGAYWVWDAFNLKIWNGSQPGSGLMPLMYGGLLCAFSVAAIVFADDQEQAEEERMRKPLLLLLLMVLTVIGFSVIGGVASLFVMMSIMFIAIEKLPPIRSLLVAAAVAAFFSLVFDRWLSVSLPHGPWGF